MGAFSPMMVKELREPEWHQESSILEIQADMVLQGIPIEGRG